ncbi:MAG: peptide chain release factor N(5)-glutamine methyltransferase [Sedimentibacter sp.]|uniref:peptide chain release factor N(5)-glutamine methyltransferase n=1 Tax=Sedimentibacter sp. TaxID=1960295 RepID=UPI002980C8A2|nr:peptide chain release factor N(5)-glutamine methyltransferase [Sedimentibacter sp.]MDW5298842.1 peptide chain release factor N(5)-glutamine methyltransferase [Sedimentibacter sp.]
MVTIEKLLKDGIEIIKQRDYNNPSLDVQLILSCLFKKDKIYLHLHRKDEVDDLLAERFYQMAKKRDAGYPLQYMTNLQEFMGLEFYVQEGILVPRPDTETLVEKIIKIVNNSDMKDKTIKILDIGTGSGAIAISLAYYLKNSVVTAIDISDIALETANINIKKHNLKNIQIKKADIFKEDFSDNKYDIVVSNPPYIETSIIKNLPVEVSTYEPKLALDGGKDGLDFYRHIVKVFEKIRENNAILCVEIGFNQKETVTKIFNDVKIFNKIEVDKDLGGNDRVVTAY